MIALDTNALARLLLADDPVQMQCVKALLAKKQTYTAPITVMLELVWVLEANDCTPSEIARGLDLLLGLGNFQPDHGPQIQEALTHYAQGMDFADALHLSLCGNAERLMTFDKKFCKLANKRQTTPVVSLIDGK